MKDEYGYRDDVSKDIQVNESTPTCGILARSEEGVTINSPYGWFTIPQAFFIMLLIFSGTSLAMGWEFPLLDVKTRWLLFWISLALLLINFGALSLLG